MNTAQVMERKKNSVSISSSKRMLAYITSHTEIVVPCTVVHNDTIFCSTSVGK
jgi:hypothetical protein